MDMNERRSQSSGSKFLGATHHSLYDIDSDKAIPKLEEVFGRHLYFQQSSDG